MIPRPLLLTGMLGAAVAGPVVVSNAPEEWRLPWAEPNTGGPLAAATPAPYQPTIPPLPSDELPHNGSLIYRSPAPLGGAVVSLEDALRMDVDPRWVYARWARKSTGLGDPELFGVRAPLVTGRGMTDLAGALSYYFDADGVAQRLRFHGRTADTTRIVALAVQRFGMQRQRGQPGEQLFQRRTRRGVEGELRTRPEAVLWGTSPHKSFVVDLEVNRPGSGRFVAPPQLKLDLPAPTGAEQAVAVRPEVGPTAAAGPSTAPTASGPGADGDGSLLGLQPGRLPPHRWPH